MLTEINPACNCFFIRRILSCILRKIDMTASPFAFSKTRPQLYTFHKGDKMTSAKISRIVIQSEHHEIINFLILAENQA